MQGVMKPISAGGRADAELLKRATSSDQSLDTINPIFLRDPLSPNIAAAREERVLDLAPVFDAFDRLSKIHDCVLVEGVGGLLVPIEDDFLVADLAARFDLPLLIVARAALGTINHTLLTIEAARSRGLQINSVIYNTLSPGDPRCVGADESRGCDAHFRGFLRRVLSLMIRMSMWMRFAWVGW